MRTLLLKLLLPASLAMSGSGAGQFLHERVVHGNPHSLQSAAAESHPTLAESTHIDGACVVCVMIAGMTADHTALTSPSIAPHDCLCIALVFDSQVFTQSFVQFPLSRGPPAAPSIIAA